MGGLIPGQHGCSVPCPCPCPCHVALNRPGTVPPGKLRVLHVPRHCRGGTDPGPRIAHAGWEKQHGKEWMSGSTQGEGSSRNRAKNPRLTTESSWDLPCFCLAPSRCLATKPRGCTQHPPERGLAPAWPCPRRCPLPAPALASCLGLPPDAQVQTRRGKVWSDSSRHWLPGGSFLVMREASLFTEQMDFGAGKHVST